MIKNSEYDYPILAEEVEKADLDSEYLWLIDPVDGTINFSRKNPWFCCCVCLAHKGKPVVGAVFNPVSNELFFAERKKGAFLNEKRIHVSDVKTLQLSMICIDSPYFRPIQRKRGIELYSRLAPPVIKAIRFTASAGLDFCYVASGVFDAYVLTGTKDPSPWDFGVGGLILEEAGGKFTDLRGNDWSLTTTDRIASNGHLHDKLLEILKGL
jgi:myo-inositol-1(or 4)-monophosphatase